MSNWSSHETHCLTVMWEDQIPSNTSLLLVSNRKRACGASRSVSPGERRYKPSEHVTPFSYSPDWKIVAWILFLLNVTRMMDKDEYCVYILVHDCICILYIWYKTKIFFLTIPVLGVYFSVIKYKKMLDNQRWNNFIVLEKNR